MEPNDIDKIIRNKVLQSHELHEQEMESAKPFVWSAVQNQNSRRRSLTWYHLAAAILLLMISFSFVVYRIQKSHKHEMNLLSNKVDQLQNNYLSQEELLQLKNSEIESLGGEVNIFERQIADLQQQKPMPHKENVVYRTDTVYLKQIKYIASVSDPVETEEITIASVKEESIRNKIAIKQGKEIDYIIFPSNSKQGKKQQSETIKFKFGSLTASRQ